MTKLTDTSKRIDDRLITLRRILLLQGHNSEVVTCLANVGLAMLIAYTKKEVTVDDKRLNKLLTDTVKILSQGE